MAWSDKVWKDDVDADVRKAVSLSSDYTNQQIRKLNNELSSLNQKIEVMKKFEYSFSDELQNNRKIINNLERQNQELEKKIEELASFIMGSLTQMVENDDMETRKRNETLDMMRKTLDFLESEMMKR